MVHHLCRTRCNPQAKQVFSIDEIQYELAGKIGDGAVGLVRKVINLKTSKTFAIKILAPDPKYIEESSFDDVAARFKREGERGCKLSHPNIIEIHKYVQNGSDDIFGGQFQNPFLLMEYVSGKTLESYIRNLASLERSTVAGTGDHKELIVIEIEPEQLNIALQIIEALEFLHKKQLVHRDIKPANIFLSKDGNPIGGQRVRIGDFGIVKWGDFHSSLTTGVLTVTGQRGLGTLKYMSPEQAISPQKVGSASDVYSLGITLFELFTRQILASPHHVVEVTLARMARGNSASRFFSMGYKLSQEDSNLGEILLDMHLRGIGSRPNIKTIKGILQRSYESKTGNRWKNPF